MNERIARIEDLFPRVVRNYSSTELRQLRVLQDWILEVGFIYKLNKNTTALALNLINNFFATAPLVRSKLQITGCSCLSLAAQINEVYAPEADNYVFISANDFTLEEFNAFTVEVVNTLGAKMRPCTALDVLAGRLYQLSKKEKESKYDAMGHARNVALLLYTYFPKYWRLSANSMADVCVSAAEYLMAGTTPTKTDQEVINNLKQFETKFVRKIKKKFGPTLALLEDVAATKVARVAEHVDAEPLRSPVKAWEGDCEEIEQLGAGTFGSVHKVRCGGRVLAVKRQELNQDALQELSILSTYQHLNIIGILERKVSPKGIEIFMEVGRSLYDVIYSPGGVPDWEDVYLNGNLDKSVLLPEEERRGYILDVCAGVDYLHSRGVIHRDLKPQNVIVVNGRAKIADFGLSIQCILSLWDNSPKQAEVLTLWYQPPEFLDKNYARNFMQYSFEIDIWSLACVLLEIETGTAPFTGDDAEEMLDAIGQVLGAAPEKDYPTLAFEEVAAPLQCIDDEMVSETLLGMLQWKPKQRLTAEEVFDRFASYF